VWVLEQAQAGRRPRLLAPVFRLVARLHPWAMTEVYLLGLVVAWVKLRDLATIELGTALFALVGLILLMIWAEASLEPHEVWERIAPQTRAASGENPAEGSFLACHCCRQLVPAAGLADRHHASCPRCGAPLHRRKPDSLARTSALLLTAAILYVPATCSRP
jgi:paraquat-inducible protein A